MDAVERVELSEDDAMRELRLLYNFADNVSRQFTRWQMLVAIHHGLSLARSNGWQDIASAPKEDERFLVWNGAIMLASDSNHVGDFFTDDGDLIRDPTHWQPLPEPPLDRLGGSEDV